MVGLGYLFVFLFVDYLIPILIVADTSKNLDLVNEERHEDEGHGNDLK